MLPATDQNFPRPPSTPPAIQGARTSQIESTDEAADRDDDGPLLALPSVNLAPVDDPGVPFGTQPPPPTTDSATNANATTAASAPRRGFLSGLFSNLGYELDSSLNRWVAGI